jgi:ferredoxin
MKVIADQESCIGSGACTMACPKVFSQDDAGTVVLIDAEPPDELRDQVLAAVDACPSACLAAADN